MVVRRRRPLMRLRTWQRLRRPGKRGRRACGAGFVVAVAAGAVVAAVADAGAVVEVGGWYRHRRSRIPGDLVDGRRRRSP